MTLPDDPLTIVALEMKFHCPACHTKLGIDARYGGSVGECPECRTSLAIPALDTEHLPRLTSRGPSRGTPAPLTQAELDFLTQPAPV